MSLKLVKQQVIVVLSLVAMFLVASTQRIEAAYGINRTINFQGKLVNASGVNVANATPVTATFSIYNANSSCPGGGTPVWSESQTFTPVDGIFQVALGSQTAFGASIDFSQDTLYLGIKVSTETNEMCSGSTRIKLAAVPYAFNAESFAGLTADNSQTNYFTITGGQGTTATVKVDGNITIGSTITPTAAGAITLQSNGANTLTLDTGLAAGINVGTTTSNAINIGRLGTGDTAGSIVKLPGGLLAQGTVKGKAFDILDEQGDQAILVASASGVNKFILDRNGLVTAAGGVTASSGNVAITTGSLTIGGLTRIDNTGVATLVSGSAIGSLTFTTNNIADSGALTIKSAAGSNALTLDSGTVGNVNLGTGSNAKTISIGTGAGGNTIDIGTDNTVKDTISIGSGLDDVAITGNGWSVTKDGLLTITSCIGCGTMPETVRRLGADYTNATASFTTITDGTDNNDQDITFQMGVNETWTFEAVLYVTSPAQADMTFRVLAPTNATCKLGFENSEDTVNIGNLGCNVSTGQLNSDGAYNVIRVNGTIITDGSNSGEVSVQFAQNSPSGTSTIATGSYIIATHVLAASGGQPMTLTGDVTGSGVGTVNTTIGPNKVLSSMILDGTISGSDLASAITISTSGNLSTTGTGTITSAGAITGPTSTNTINNLIINAATQTLSANSILDSGALTISSAVNSLLTLKSANNGAGASGGVTLSSGTITGSGTSGAVNINTGLSNTSGLSTGAITIQSGGITTSGTSGNVSLEVGTGGTLGTIQIGNATAAPINIGTSTTALKNIQIGATGTVADTINIGSTAAGAATFRSGAGLTITGGASSVWSTSGTGSNLTITSGATTANTALTINTNAVAGGTGGLTLASGNASAGASGALNFTSGTGTTGTGALNFDTGNASAGTAGNITMDVGTSSSGNGSILIGTGSMAKVISLGQTGVGGAVIDTINLATTTTAGSNSVVNIGNGTANTRVVMFPRLAAPGAEFNINGAVAFGSIANSATSGRIWVRSNNLNFRFNSASNVADYSEFIAQSEKSEQGDVMVVDSDHPETVRKSRGKYEENILGVITITGSSNNNGWCDDEVSCDRTNDPNWANLGMLGQVPVKVSTENGPINIGDRLTTSSIPGVAMKATMAGQVVGRALEAYAAADPANIGKVKTLISPTFFDPGAAVNTNVDLQELSVQAQNTTPFVAQIPYAKSGQANLASNLGKFSIQSIAGSVINTVGSFSKAIIANLQAGTINSTEITAHTITADQLALQTVDAATVNADIINAKLINADQIVGLSAMIAKLMPATSVNVLGDSTAVGGQVINFPSFDTSLQSGELVSLGQNGLQRSAGKYDARVSGVVFGEAGLVTGTNTGDLSNQRSVLTTGRSQVKVSLENGEIKAGDYLTASSVPGVAMKATKAGVVIGQALEGQTVIGAGQVLAYIKPTYFNGVSLADYAAALASSNPTFWNELVTASDETQPVSEILTDRVTAGLEMMTPRLTADKIVVNELQIGKEGKIVFDASGSAVFSGGITADYIKTNRVETPNQLLARMGLLEDRVASISGQLASLSNAAGVTPTPTTTMNWSVLGDLVANQGLTVKGQGEFLGDVTFRNNVQFDGTPFFNKDLAGFAVVKKDSDRVDVVFDKEYSDPPIVTTNITFSAINDAQGNMDDGANKDLEKQLLQENYNFVVSRKTKKGFTIVLNKPALQDINFSWTAFVVKQAKIFSSSAIPVTPMPTALPILVLPTPIISPTQPASGSATGVD